MAVAALTRLESFNASPAQRLNGFGNAGIEGRIVGTMIHHE